MPKYSPRVLQRYKHTAPSKPQHSPYQAQPKKYGTVAQDPLSQDNTTKLDDNCKKCIQQIVGTLFYYVHVVDLTILPALSSIASEQAEATKNTEKCTTQLLDYMTMHPDATVHFHASQMILNIHSDASYLSEKGAKSCIAGQFFLGSHPTPNKPIMLNGAIYTCCGIPHFIVASTAEAEPRTLFLNCKEGKLI